ncbi:hypothetical protein IAQ61_010669 [Plenodomus lingam]|uniref:Uncharacterized protein n=1 Tax=Leptosphaeria maculans (strain JN3 / isolate v23.1.3 / race Av1-4-5-6-7-8) TaxID=985895 RepID=E4ZJM0_LEPMJ|nr:hypothetical protein LEMA_P068130.1 [Plenodomus lingam JN3]KAH9860933.1 hypothetical protein IAQ61_010669 [Plenodomus lingam]CBX91305.1 hypothetical protein LEMA_P068130.1 [Plenodomus lingam JN3]
MEPHSRPCSSQNGTLRLPQALLLFLRTVLAGPDPDRVSQADAHPANWPDIRNLPYRLTRLLNPFAIPENLASVTAVGMVKLAAVCGIGSAFWLWSNQRTRRNVSEPQSQSNSTMDASSATDPGLIKKFSHTRAYTVPSTGFTYPRIRTFYRTHDQETKLPREPSPLPLLVFIHGLGGSIAQFNPILLSLSNLASCLAIDLPGCGASSFEPKAWDAYTTEALVHLLAVVIEEYRAVNENQTVILVGHSMGCSLATLLASSTSPLAHLMSIHVGGVIAICPKAEPPTEKESKQLRTITLIPATVFDLLRKWDRRGGANSKSVLRMAGPDAEEGTKVLQLRYNQQSRSAVWQRMAKGMCPDYSTGQPRGGLPGKAVWSGLDVPVFLVAGEDDTVTPITNVKRIVEFLGRDVSAIQSPSEKVSLPIAAAPFDPAVILPADPDSTTIRKHQDSGIDANDLPKIEDDTDMTDSMAATNDVNSVTTRDTVTDSSQTLLDAPLVSTTPTHKSSNPSPHPRRLVVKILILPKPAAHALLFAPTTSRIISGLIGNFFADHIDPRLSLSWQLNYLSTEGKWDVKNLAKWKAVQPVSEPIGNVFRAMKTLREVDEEHTPRVLAQKWKGKLSAVIDISHDSPVYDPKGLEDGGIPYHKFPTVSKQPPQPDEVRAFIELVDRIRAEGRPGLIGVHCHYGFNRTGFFVVAYLVERQGRRVEEAIDMFEAARPPGIRHSHFIDQLHVRYARNLRRAPTL